MDKAYRTPAEVPEGLGVVEQSAPGYTPGADRPWVSRDRRIAGRDFTRAFMGYRKVRYRRNGSQSVMGKLWRLDEALEGSEGLG